MKVSNIDNIQNIQKPKYSENKNQEKNLFNYSIQNIILILMLIVLIFSFIKKKFKLFQNFAETLKNFNSQVKETIKLFKNKISYSISHTLNDSKEHYIYPNYWCLVFGFLIILIISAFFLFSYLKEVQKDNIMNQSTIENQIKSNPYMIRQNKKDYELLKNYCTKQEIKKLYQNDDFKKMKIQKGDDPSNWNWQVKERLNKVENEEDKSDSDFILYLSD